MLLTWHFRDDALFARPKVEKAFLFFPLFIKPWAALWVRGISLKFDIFHRFPLFFSRCVCSSGRTPRNGLFPSLGKDIGTFLGEASSRHILSFLCPAAESSNWNLKRSQVGDENKTTLQSMARNFCLLVSLTQILRIYAVRPYIEVLFYHAFQFTRIGCDHTFCSDTSIMKSVSLFMSSRSFWPFFFYMKLLEYLIDGFQWNFHTCVLIHKYQRLRDRKQVLR